MTKKQTPKPIRTVDDLNKRNAEFWKGRINQVAPLLKNDELVEKAVSEIAWQAYNEDRIKKRDDFYVALEKEKIKDMAEKYSEHQSGNAKNERGKIGDDDETMESIVKRFIFMPEHQDAKTKELWPFLWSELDCRGLDPKDIDDPNDWKKSRYEYIFKGGRKSISGGAFANIVASLRK